jgi:hypothetical protein
MHASHAAANHQKQIGSSSQSVLTVTAVTVHKCSVLGMQFLEDCSTASLAIEPDTLPTVPLHHCLCVCVCVFAGWKCSDQPWHSKLQCPEQLLH